METKTKRIYPSSQLICALDCRVLKVLMWILGWQNQGSIKYYPKQYAKACKMTEEEIDLCIQTLVDCKLLDVSRIDQTWMLTPNGEQFQKYYDIPISKVIEGNGIKMADKITWNEVEKKDDSRLSDDFFKKKFDQVTDHELECLVKELQRRREEKKNGCQVVYPSDVDKEFNDLPF